MFLLCLLILQISSIFCRARHGDLIHFEADDDPINVGDSCRNTTTGSAGTCAYYQQCPALLQTPELKPRICFFQDKTPIVCCPKNQTSSVIETETRISTDQCPKIFTNSLRFGDDVLGIVNGNLVKKEEFPFMVGLAVFTDSSPGIKINCGGTLISDQFVVTAAHCFRTENPNAVILGIKDINNRPLAIERAVEKIIIHPEYRFDNNYNDIALIKMNESVLFTNNVRPACLWQSETFDESHVQTAGWGDTSFVGSASDNLLEVTLAVVPKDECQKHFPPSLRIPDGVVDSQLCAGHFDKDACQGDSGGPLSFKKFSDDGFHQEYIVGVTSFGKGCGNGAPGVYTRIGYYLDWIEKNVWL